MSYKEIFMILPDSVYIKIACCDKVTCDGKKCSNQTSSTNISIQEARKHCITVRNLGLYPIVLSADNKVKCGVLTFSINGTTRVVSNDHFWSFTQQINQYDEHKVNEITLNPIQIGKETLETDIDVLFLFNGAHRTF